MNSISEFILVSVQLAEPVKRATESPVITVGVYKDDPAKVPAEELQSLAGVVLDEEDSKKSGLPSKKYAAQKTLQTMFPYYGILSIMLAVYKCYSGLPKAMGETCKDNATAEDSYGECIEVYEAATNTMTFHVVRK